MNTNLENPQKEVVSRPVSVRAKRALDLVANGGLSKKEAIIKAGFSKNTAKTPKKVFGAKSLQDLLEQFLPDTKLLEVHQEGLTAERFIENAGEVPDYAIRHKYLETAYKIKGHMKGEGTPGVQINMMSIRNKYA